MNTENHGVAIVHCFMFPLQQRWTKILLKREGQHNRHYTSKKLKQPQKCKCFTKALFVVTSTVVISVYKQLSLVQCF